VTGSILGDEAYFDTRRTAPGWRSWYYIRESAPLSALAADGARYRGRVSHSPALAAAAAFRATLIGAGVRVAGGARLGRVGSEELELASIESPTLLQIVRIVNRDSDNFTAEVLLKHLGAATTGRGTTAAGAGVVTRTLRDALVPVAGVRIVDGSGLSLSDRLTANALVAILAAAWRDPALRAPFLSTLAVAGRTGTLRRRLRGTPAAGQVLAKTGTTRQSCALAGYVGGRYAFAVLQNGAPVSTSWSRTAQDRFVTVLARQKR
jgi:D-alanyl-D-alanine carboxypeptidase/D-alanyl-D-alanine-endopeptidase (penicillin-binding protein 4)